MSYPSPQRGPGYVQQGYPVPGARPPGKSRAGLIFGIVVVLVAAVCGVGVYFGVLHKHSGSAGAAAVVGPFGDVGTLDPCSLVNADAFAAEGTAVHIQPNTLDACDVYLVLDSGAGGYDIGIYPVNRVVDPSHVDPAWQVDPVGALHIAKAKLESGTGGVCERLVYDDNGVGVRISADLAGDAVDGSGNPKPGYDSCAVGDQAAAAVVAAVQGNTLVHLHYPQDSVGSIDLCQTLTAADVNSAVGATEDQVDTRDTARDACPFQTPASPHLPRMLMRAALYTPAAWAAHVGMSTTVELAGRTTRFFGHTTDTAQNVEDTSCYARTAQKNWASWPGKQVFGGDAVASELDDGYTSSAAPGLVEVVEITVLMPRGTSVLTCRAAVQQLATKVWPKLPPPTA